MVPERSQVSEETVPLLSLAVGAVSVTEAVEDVDGTLTLREAGQEMVGTCRSDTTTSNVHLRQNKAKAQRQSTATPLFPPLPVPH